MTRSTPLAVTLVLWAASSPAQITAVELFVVDPGIDGFATTDLAVSFEGQLGEQQLTLDLLDGEIFNAAPSEGGGDLPPSETLLAAFPLTAYDTFVTAGGLTRQTADDPVIIGGAVDLGGGADAALESADRLSARWAPSPAVAVQDRAAYPISRLTVSDDARGVLSYLGKTADDGVFQTRWLFASGTLAPVEPLAGDFNFDLSVNNTDLNLLLNNWGEPRVAAEWVHGFLRPEVDNGELNALLISWGQSGVSPFAVPEPSAAPLLLLLAAAPPRTSSSRTRKEQAR
ncbi:MAG: hypothetical protein AAFV43_07425 [Planctomycetota bacterium]